MVDLRQTSSYANFMQSIGWKVEQLGGIFAYIKRFPILGNFIKLQRPEKLQEKLIKILLRKYRPYQFIVEPKNPGQIKIVERYGFKQSKSFYVPSKTLEINLENTESNLLKMMHYKTRYNISLGEKLNLNARRSSDIESFANFWQMCALQQRGMYLSQKKEIVQFYKSFLNKAYIVNVETDGERLSSILLLCTKDKAYYMYAASTEKGRKMFAPTLCAWKAILLAKGIGIKLFDFEGIYDERFPIKSWLGFTRFKKSFGGNEVQYPGTFTRVGWHFALK